MLTTLALQYRHIESAVNSVKKAVDMQAVKKYRWKINRVHIEFLGRIQYSEANKAGGLKMHLKNQPIIPAVRTIKDFEDLMHWDFPYLILLESHLGQLQGLLQLAHRHKKKVILHADLVQGLKNDEYGAQFLCQVIKPDGLISTHQTVITTARKRGLIAIQRIFLLDSHSLETSYRILQSSQPHYIEVLPGVLPEVIREIRERTHLPILAGGFIRTPTDIQTILEAGATAVTTSSRELWSVAKSQQLRN